MNIIDREQLASAQTYCFEITKLTQPGARSSAGRLSGPASSPTADVLTELRPEKDTTPAEAFQLYLREIGQVKLLTPEEEIDLANRIKRGDQEAREQMIKANLRLVVKIARDYEGLGLPLLDLISEGNIGLMKGVERFEPTKGAKLSTYACWWIKHAIKRALGNQSKTIRLPVHVTHKVAHIRRAEIRLREALDREATEEEVAMTWSLIRAASGNTARLRGGWCAWIRP